MVQKTFQTPLGKIVVVADEVGICSLDFDENALECKESNVHIEQLMEELDEYFKGKRKEFSVALNPKVRLFKEVFGKFCKAFLMAKLSRIVKKQTSSNTQKPFVPWRMPMAKILFLSLSLVTVLLPKMAELVGIAVGLDVKNLS